MDDFNTNVLSEARNEYSSRLLNIITPLVIEGFSSIFKEAYDSLYFSRVRRRFSSDDSSHHFSL